MPKARKKPTPRKKAAGSSGQGVQPIWSGAIAFGLVNVPVDLLAAVRARDTAMKLIDKEGHALGRQYRCSRDGKVLGNDELVRGYETKSGDMVVVTDAEFETVAPEMSGEIAIRNFVDADQIPPLYFDQSYLLAPAGKTATTYNLLAAVMQRTGRAAVGSFVMRGHEYLVAIISDNGVLRADTLRHADEIRSPGSIGLPARMQPAPATVDQFVREIAKLQRDDLSMAELKDKEAAELQALVKSTRKDGKRVIRQPQAQAAQAETTGTSAQIIDLTEILRRSLSKRVVVTPVGK